MGQFMHNDILKRLHRIPGQSRVEVEASCAVIARPPPAGHRPVSDERGNRQTQLRLPTIHQGTSQTRCLIASEAVHQLGDLGSSLTADHKSPRLCPRHPPTRSPQVFNLKPLAPEPRSSPRFKPVVRGRQAHSPLTLPRNPLAFGQYEFVNNLPGDPIGCGYGNLTVWGDFESEVLHSLSCDSDIHSIHLEYVAVTQ